MTKASEILNAMSDDQLIALAISQGWSVGAVCLYDEECVEGWRWESPDDKTDLSCVGAWDKQHIDDSIRAAIVGDLSARGITQVFNV